MNYKYFTEEELKCKCGCGQSNPNPQFHVLMLVMDRIREEVGFPLVVTSAYRCPKHPIEAAKDTPGQHSISAIDIGVHGNKGVELLRVAMKYDLIKGVGVNQKGKVAGRFLHFDNRRNPAIWSY